MTLRAVFLDAGPLGLVTQKPGKSANADDCRKWAVALQGAGVVIVIPSITDYEVRRELLRSKATSGIVRLDGFWVHSELLLRQFQMPIFALPPYYGLRHDK